MVDSEQRIILLKTSQNWSPTDPSGQRWEPYIFQDKYGNDIKVGNLVVSKDFDEFLVLGPSETSSVFYLQLSANKSWYIQYTIKAAKEERHTGYFNNTSKHKFFLIQEEHLSKQGKETLEEIIKNDWLRRIYYGSI